MKNGKNKFEQVFDERFNRHRDELRWLYMELYENGGMFDELCTNMKEFFMSRDPDLRQRDRVREENPDWYKRNDLLGMMLYIDNFAGNLKGVMNKLGYLDKCQVNCIHLMPFLESPKGRSDGGYAVSDYRRVQEEYGTMEDLSVLTQACHAKDMNVCMDFVMNHTSEDHKWAKRARAGEREYMDRFFFFKDEQAVGEYEKTVPQVFPTTAPGNFTWLEDVGQYVLTTFYPYQWDLNYRNPRVFNEMIYHLLFLANRGIDIFRLDAVPYIWKTLYTSCRNLPQVHTIVRMMRMAVEIVCPGVLLLGEVVMEPDKVVPYFGTLEKPECHLLYNVTTMATTWHTVATRDIRLLKKQLDTVNHLPKEYTFVNYLRCHDDIGWGLDYQTLSQYHMEEGPHKKYLNDYFRGLAGMSHSRGELYNDDPALQDARFCGTTASMCGIETALDARDTEGLKKAICLDVMLHAYMFMQSGIPVLYSGDEIGQCNDLSYKKDPEKAQDSRYIHRGKMDWEAVKRIHNPDSVEGKLFSQLSRLETIRRQEPAFDCSADVWTLETWDQSVLCVVRQTGEEKLIGLFNFSEQDRTAWINETDGLYQDLISGKVREAKGVDIPGYGFFLLKRETDGETARAKFAHAERENRSRKEEVA